MTFSIEFLPRTEWQSRFGRIRLGDFQEEFLSNLAHWSERDYERQWNEGLTRIVSVADSRSALITSTGDPSRTSGVQWWTLYRENERVYVQHALLFFATLAVPFDISDPYKSIPPRYVAAPDEEPVCEWVISVQDIRTFLDAAQ